jgi:hypothetical protein
MALQFLQRLEVVLGKLAISVLQTLSIYTPDFYVGISDDKPRHLSADGIVVTSETEGLPTLCQRLEAVIG